MKRLVPIVILLLICMSSLSAAAPAANTTALVKEGEVRQVLTDYIKKRTANLGVELNIKKIGYSGDMALPKGQVSYEVIAPRQWEGWGNANLALIVRVNDRVEHNVTVRVEVEALADVLVATRPLERGEIIGAKDVAMQKRDLATVTGKIYRSPDEAQGKRVRTAMRANSPIRSDYLEKVPLVKSGQLVTIVLENDVLRLTATGRVKNAGAEGDMVLVQNLTSQKDIPARVVDTNTVRVEF